MRLIYSALLALIFVTFLPVFAEDSVKLQIIYPKNNAVINSQSTFIVGNTEPDANLLINDQPVKVSPNGAFVQVVPLNKGANNINIKSTKGHAINEIPFTINVPENKKTPTPVVLPEPLSAVAEIIKDYAVTRTYPDKSRLTPLLSGTILDITGKLKDSYRFKYSNCLDGWISEKDIKILPAETPTSEIILDSLNIDSDKNYVYLKLPLPTKSPFLIEQNCENQMNLKLFGVKAGIDLFSYDNANDFLKELKWTQQSNDCLNLTIKTNSKQFWGYKYYYEGNTFVLRLRKQPQIKHHSPLKNKIICIDAGHGGTELGAVGPTGVPEKLINLGIAENLRKILEKKGAKVIMTRDSDKDVGLNERVDLANSNEAQVIISIHNNSLPDGKDPYKEHGSSTYYYHSQSLPLAKEIQQSLVKTIELKDLGVFYSSFVLTRPQEALSVLVEVGFMINPDEYNLLITPEFQEKAATGIAQGLENFFLSRI